jgi:hypothetical protein
LPAAALRSALGTTTMNEASKSSIIAILPWFRVICLMTRRA